MMTMGKTIVPSGLQMRPIHPSLGSKKLALVPGLIISTQNWYKMLQVCLYVDISNTEIIPPTSQVSGGG